MIKRLSERNIDDYLEYANECEIAGEKVFADCYRNDAKIAGEVLNTITVEELLIIFYIRNLPRDVHSNVFRRLSAYYEAFCTYRMLLGDLDNSIKVFKHRTDLKNRLPKDD